MLPNYVGKVRLVFKDFPLEQLPSVGTDRSHRRPLRVPAGPQGFWKMYDSSTTIMEIIRRRMAWNEK